MTNKLIQKVLQMLPLLAALTICSVYIDVSIEQYINLIKKDPIKLGCFPIRKIPTEPILLLNNKPVKESFASLASVTEILEERKRINRTESYSLSELHVSEILKYSDASLGEWNTFRKRSYLLADSLINEFKLPISNITLYAFLMKTFYVESKYKAHAKNPHSSATGVIQWMSMHYKKYGFTREQFAKLSEVEQLPYVAKYFRKELSKIKHKGDLNELRDWVDYYCLVYYPSIADKPDWVVMAKSCNRKCSPKCAYHANSGYDYNKDGVIRKGEIVLRINKKLK